MKISAEFWMAGIVFLVVGLKLANQEDKKNSVAQKMGDDLDFMGRDDYFADMGGGINVFKKGSNITNEDFIISRKATPTLNSLPRKVRITNRTEAI